VPREMRTKADRTTPGQRTIALLRDIDQTESCLPNHCLLRYQFDFPRTAIIAVQNEMEFSLPMDAAESVQSVRFRRSLAGKSESEATSPVGSASGPPIEEITRKWANGREDSQKAAPQRAGGNRIGSATGSQTSDPDNAGKEMSKKISTLQSPCRRPRTRLRLSRRQNR
jgi:hypothetical protein